MHSRESIPSPSVLVTTLQHVMQLQINNPRKKNALDQAIYTALIAALLQAQKDPFVRVVVLRGSDDTFCSGNDIAEFVEKPEMKDDAPVLRFLETIAQFEKPLIAAVNGSAVGIGASLLLHCDLVYASADAMFHLPFVNLGLCPEAGSTLLLPQLMGYQRAAELILLGKRFDADTAQEIGVVTTVFAKDVLQEYVMQKAQQLAAQPPAAVRIAKRLMRKSWSSAVKQAMQDEAKHFALRLRSPEFSEAAQAFLEHRAPNFDDFD